MQEDALALAKAIEEVRRRRRNFFDKGLFDEHAWDVLLILFIAAEEGRAVHRQELVGIAAASEQLLQRWITVLEGAGELERSDSSTSELRLSFEGKRKMRHTLSPVHSVS